MQTQYELMLILKPQADLEDGKKITQLMGKLIMDKGKVVKSDSLGKKTFSYPIKSENQGYYLLLNLELEGKEANELSRRLKQEELILRHLLVKKGLSQKV